MAAVFRISARLGWNEQIGNHNSLILPRARPDEPPLFMINPRGYRFEELTASSLIVCDLDGKVLRGTGELRKVAFHIHARIHLHNPAAACVLHVHPQYLTALSMLQNPEMSLAHFNNLSLNDRVVIDAGGEQGVGDNVEGDRIAKLLGDKTIMIMASHGVTVVGPTVHDAFDELFSAERTTMYQFTAMSTGQPLRRPAPGAQSPPLQWRVERARGCPHASRRLAPHPRQGRVGLRHLKRRPKARPGLCPRRASLRVGGTRQRPGRLETHL